MFFVYPALVGSTGDTLVSNFFHAVKETHTVNHVVYLSTMRPAPNNEDVELAHKNYENEQTLIHSGIPFTILRPTYFHENMVANFANSIKRDGEYRTSAGLDGVWTSVAITAVVAMATLANPNAHAGKVYSLREEAVTHAQVAEKIGNVIGKKVKVVNLTPEEHSELVMKTYNGPAGSVAAMADTVVRSDTEKREGQFSEQY